MSTRTSPIGCGVKRVHCQAYQAVEVLILAATLDTRLAIWPFAVIVVQSVRKLFPNYFH